MSANTKATLLMLAVLATLTGAVCIPYFGAVLVSAILVGSVWCCCRMFFEE